jgi:hypothetical protein
MHGSVVSTYFVESYHVGLRTRPFAKNQGLEWQRFSLLGVLDTDGVVAAPLMLASSLAFQFRH